MSMGGTRGRVVSSAWHNRRLLVMMVRRDIAGRYRGSLLGVAWSLFVPILMLGVYTFVFSVVFNARWGTDTSHRGEFAVALFVGLMLHGLLAECLTRAPGLIVSHTNLVKRVVFPLEILPLSMAGSALFNLLVNVLVLLVAMLLFGMSFHWTMVLFPLMALPVLLYALGVSFFLSAIGVFLRDVAQVTGMLSTLLLFLAPVFYPQEALPEAYRPWLNINPLTFVIESSRDVMLDGRVPDWGGWLISVLVASAVAGYGAWWFQRSRNGFADVL